MACLSLSSVRLADSLTDASDGERAQPEAGFRRGVQGNGERGGAKAMVVLEVLALFVTFKTVAELVNAQRMPKMLFGADMRPMAL